ncbi:hypothetical protein WJX81_006624 [Elliptochloris bilobata]|uniref:Reticulon-like protein n=1 Tax=Elliptochloris bilobata TaxID=381761 RepID=A0AAW1SCW6_9CHLO
MTVYECNCGLTKSNASELHAHIKSFKGTDLAHFLVTMSRRPGLRSARAPLSSTSSSEPGSPLTPREESPQRGADAAAAVTPATPTPAGSASPATPGVRAPAGELAAAPGTASAGLATSYHALTQLLAAADSHAGAAAGGAAGAGVAGTGAAEAPSSPGQPQVQPPARSGGRLGRTLDLLGWSQMPAGPPTSRDPLQAADPAAISVEAAEALLLWHDPWASAKVFGSGLYALICLRHLVFGVEVVQPTTLAAGGAIFVLLYNALASALPRRTLPSTAVERAHEDRLQAAVARRVRSLGDAIAPAAAATVALVARRLSGRDSAATRVWTGIALYTLLVMGELRILSQTGLAIAAWCALFGLPPLYAACRHALDALVEEVGVFAGAVVAGGEKRSLAAAGGVGVLLLAGAGGALLLRATLAVAAVFLLLLWRAHRLRAAAVCSPQSFHIACK